MMISYFHLLAIGSSRQPVFHDHSPHLRDLISLRVPSLRLQIQDFLNPGLGEDVMTAANPLVESEATKQAAQPVERNVGIRSAAQDLNEKRVALDHGRSLAECLRKAERRAHKRPAH